MLSLLALQLFLSASGPEVVFSGHRITLSPVADPVVVRSTHPQAISSRLPNARIERVLGQWSVIYGQPSIARALLRDHEADEALAVYETDDGHRLFADRHVLVRFDAGIDAEQVTALVTAAGASDAKVRHSARNEFDVLAPSSDEAIDVASRLAAARGVLWSHPDFIVHVDVLSAPTDPYFASSYHHEILNSVAAWDATTRGKPESIVAVLDSGTDLSHPEFAGKVLSPHDFLDNDDDPDPARDDAHGTACSGIATALADNGIGIVGVCPGCSLMPVRMLDENGFTRSGGAAQAINWAVSHQARTISCSWSLSPVPTSLSDALASADTAGALVFYASGNSATTIQATDIAANPHVHAVGATDQYDTVASYSNTGSQLFITAPSPNIVTDISTNRGYANGAYYTSFAGTSGSTPVVAGLAGLIWSQRSDLTNTQVASILSSTADHVGSDAYVSGRNDTYGFGRVNAYRAMLSAASLAPCVPQAENCSNGVDDDCDALIDANDPQCAPADIPLGGPCTADFQCSAKGFCLNDDLGYPGGYCVPSASCGGTGAGDCPVGSTCVGEGYATSSQCHASCDEDGDCRAGYWCRTFGQARACVPSCEAASCLTGETCDPATKQCVHNGGAAVGDPCSARVDCAGNGRCLTDASGYHGGFCVTECQDTGVCGDGEECLTLGEGTSFCLPLCSKAEDCREFYACHPVDNNGTTIGYCFNACLTDDDCNGKKCNSYGLCGDDTPPVPNPSTSGSGDKKDDGGCAAAGAETLSVLSVLVLGLRRFNGTPARDRRRRKTPSP